MKPASNLLYEQTLKIFRDHNLPVDKFGHFYLKGGLTCNDVVNPDFRDEDFMIAALIRVAEKVANLEQLINKGGDSDVKQETESPRPKRRVGRPT